MCPLPCTPHPTVSTSLKRRASRGLSPHPVSDRLWRDRSVQWSPDRICKAKFPLCSRQGTASHFPEPRRGDFAEQSVGTTLCAAAKQLLVIKGWGQVLPTRHLEETKRKWHPHWEPISRKLGGKRTDEAHADPGFPVPRAWVTRGMGRPSSPRTQSQGSRQGHAPVPPGKKHAPRNPAD